MSIEYFEAVKWPESQDDLAKHTSAINKPDLRGAAIGGMVSIVTHNKQLTLRDIGLIRARAPPLTTVKIFIHGFIDDIVLVKCVILGNIHYIVIEIYFDIVPGRCYHALDDVFVVAICVITGLMKNYDIELLRLIKKIGYNELIIMCQRLIHGRSVYLAQSENKGQKQDQYAAAVNKGLYLIKDIGTNILAFFAAAIAWNGRRSI